MNEIFTPPQKQVLSDFKNGRLKRINLLDGSVRSGKTWISLVLWALWVATMPKDGGFLMVGKTLGTLKRNCLDMLLTLVGNKNFCYSLSKKEGILCGRRVYLEGASDARSESKIRGMTLCGAYCDELTLFDEDFFTMLLSRLSVSGAKLFATTNPDNPNHWLYKKYIMRKSDLDFKLYKFLIGQNSFLSPEYVENLKKEYTGVFYERFILGNWVAAEGVIYREFADNTERFIIDGIDPKDIAFASVGVDFGGNKSAHAFVCNGYTKNFNKVITLDEFYLKDRISPSELEKKFIEFILKQQERYNVYEVYCDSAETTLIEGLRIAAAKCGLRADIRLAKKGKITERIRFFNRLMSMGRYFVMRHCKNVIEALCSAVWDDKSISDTRLDNGFLNVDSLDALEYATEKYFGDII
ncbi:MAG: PBSX family phage terminase large subunit [Oscillospiraceae bacterium]|nr:PBSX family phage terminase large subunit [Oscillospiraceae bacterium]